MAPTETTLPRPSSADSNGLSPTSTASPFSVADPLAPALEALDQLRPEETVALAHARLQSDPADASAYAILGVAYCQMGQMSRALQALERAHYLNPHDARILYNYGLVLEAAGRPAAAKIRFFAALKLSPQYSRALERMAAPLPEQSMRAKLPEAESRPPGPMLDRLRENEFQSSWIDGPLPKPSQESVRLPEIISNNPASDPDVTTNQVTFSSELGSAPNTLSPPQTVITEVAVLPETDGEQRAARRGIGGMVLVPVLALGLLVGGVLVKAFWPGSFSAKSTAPVKTFQTASQSPAQKQGTPKAEARPGGPSHRQAQMVGADLRDKSLANADFEEANLSRSKLIRADLRGASFVHASLAGADLRNAGLVRANLLGALLRDTDLRGADLRNAYLKSAELSNANLSAAWLEGATLTHSGLRQAILVRTQLPNAKLQNAMLTRANLREANLRNADLRNADLRGADLTGASLDSATLTGTRYDRDTRWPHGLQPEARGAILLLPASP